MRLLTRQESIPEEWFFLLTSLLKMILLLDLPCFTRHSTKYSPDGCAYNFSSAHSKPDNSSRAASRRRVDSFFPSTSISEVVMVLKGKPWVRQKFSTARV